jgi:phospholipid/cholesterol/gamma-HCH transport system substrate-binding protein
MPHGSFRPSPVPRTRRSAVWSRLIAVVGAALVLLSGCGFHGVYDMPLPGGADIGDHPYQVKARFQDVLDLVPNAGVRVNDVPVGRVEAIGLAPNAWQAEVTLAVNGDVRLPANAIAQLKQSSLLGEKYVELAAPPPPEQPTGRLTNGATIGIDRTNRNPEVEEVLGALSLLLNGGGVGQLQDITRELNAALSGRESDVRGLLNNLNQLVASLDAQRNDITNALDAVNRLSASLNSQRGNIDVALRDLGPGLQVLNDQRGQLVTMLESLNRLSGVATNVVNRSQGDMVHDLNDLAPTLRQLAAAGDSLPKSFQVLVTFPFPDNAVDGIKGSDYTNLYVNADLNLTDILDNLQRNNQPVLPANPNTPPVPLPSQPPSSSSLLPSPSQSPAPSPAPSGGLLGNILGGP